MCLELTPVDSPVLKPFYDFYSFNIIPKMGQVDCMMRIFEQIFMTVDGGGKLKCLPISC